MDNIKNRPFFWKCYPEDGPVERDLYTGGLKWPDKPYDIQGVWPHWEKLLKKASKKVKVIPRGQIGHIDKATYQRNKTQYGQIIQVIITLSYGQKETESGRIGRA